MNISEINGAIMNGNWTNDHINSMVAAIKYARGKLVNKAISATEVGSDVKFVSSRTGRYEYGKVVKVARKYINVRVGNTTWRVPGNMLEAA